MTFWSEFYQRHPLQVMELMIEECCREHRPMFWLDTGDEWSNKVECDWCERRALYEFREYNDNCEPPVPNMHRDPTCGSPACVAAEAWFNEPKRGYRRRKMFYAKWGFECQKTMQLEIVLAMMIESEARVAA